ncbi:unnamed protein product [Hymenolepis diminuta]|nr:unnamed protein product [Hymenolepis diminuta]
MPPRGLSKDNLRWVLHSRTCIIEGRQPRKICRDPRCRELKRIKQHVQSCRAGKNCRIDLCATITECKEHWESCSFDQCFTCKEMVYALHERLSPDVVNYPQPSPDNLLLSPEERSERIRLIVDSFYPYADFTDLQDEKLKTAIERARIVEAQSYQCSRMLTEYDLLNEHEIKRIKGLEE